MSYVHPHVRYARSADGVRIAATTFGKGPPIVRVAPWFSHIESDARGPVWAHWMRSLSRDHSCVCYDQRGCGLSDWAPPAIAFDACVGDLEAVVDRLGLARFALLGMSEGAATAIAYAARHPGRVSHLVLLGGYGRGPLRRGPAAGQRREAEMLLELIRFGWGHDNPAYRQVFTSLYIPQGTREQQRWFNDLAHVAATPANAAAILEMTYQIDVMGLAETIEAPTLIFHARHDARVPFEEGRLLAASIAAARFVPLESYNHILLEEEPAWSQFLAELRAFLATPGAVLARQPPVLAAAGLTPSEFEVLKLVAQGLDNRTIAAAFGKSEKTVRNQVSAVFGKLGVRSRAEAIVRARDAGIERLSS